MILGIILFSINFYSTRKTTAFDNLVQKIVITFVQIKSYNYQYTIHGNSMMLWVNCATFRD